MLPHSSIINVGGVEFTHGPDARRGGENCRTQHEGTREGILDSCCCCDPCRYKRPPFNNFTGFSCRCVPRLICMTFTPDVTANECCRPIGQPMVAVFNAATPGPHYDNTPWSITYTGTISGITCTLTISTHNYNGPAFWKVDTSSTAGTVSSEIEIDHINVTCLSVPDISITGVVDLRGCTGTISFSNYDSTALPFNHTPPTFEEYCELITLPLDSPDPQCDCLKVPRYLCVDGIRRFDDEREQVRFTWNESLNDRWSYLPCDGNISTDQEHIYLRGDNYGNCYLELDFEQSGTDTNDWAVPPNTLGVDIHEIRPGMIPIESCGRDIHAHSEVLSYSGNNLNRKFVNVTAGECGCWKYACGNCRCVPNSICLMGQIDGEIVEGEALWDGEKWVFTGDTYTGPFSIALAKDDCGACVLRVTGSFAVAFQDSEPIECGEFLSGEVFSEFDSLQPEAFNQLWIQATICNCIISPCGICADERCGGPPKTIYFEIDADSVFEPDPIFLEYNACNITIPLQYFQRLQRTDYAPGLTIVCGYIGYKIVYCPDAPGVPAHSYVIRVSITYFLGNFRWEMSRAELNGGPLIFSEAVIPSTLFPPAGWTTSCDPFIVDSGVLVNTALRCRWGCGEYQMRLRFTFVE